MTSHPHPSDEDLRAAIKRLRGGHTVSPERRKRLALSMAGLAAQLDAINAIEANAHERQRPGARRLPIRWKWMGFAASVVATLALAQQVSHWAADRAEHAEYAARNQAVVKAVVAEYPTPPVTTEKKFVRFSSDAAAATAEASKLAGYRVPRLKTSNWRLISAFSRHFQCENLIQFNYADGDRRLTFVSLPAGFFIDVDEGYEFNMTVDGAPVAGYLADGGLNCLIAGRGVSADELNSLRAELRAN